MEDVGRVEGDANRGMAPKLVYMWSVVTGDGKAVPQFDPISAQKLEWAEVAGLKPEKLMWTRIPPAISQKVDEAATLPIPSVILDLRPDDIPVWTRRGELTRTTLYVCKECGAEFLWDGRCDVECKECSNGFLWIPDENPGRLCPECGEPVEVTYRAVVCPKCGARDLWYCDVCNEFKDKQLHFRNNECRCPECEPIDKHGLIRHKKIGTRILDELETHYVLGVRGLFEIEMVPFDKSRVNDVCWKLVFFGRPHLVIEYDGTEIEIDGMTIIKSKGDIVDLGPKIRVPGEFVCWVDDGNVWVRGDDGSD